MRPRGSQRPRGQEARRAECPFRCGADRGAGGRPGRPRGRRRRLTEDSTRSDSAGGVREGAVLARYYDLDLQDDPGDVPMYQALAATRDGPILELAVGTGRIAVPLAAAGHHVTGVDRDPHMLDRARRKWAAHSDTMSGRRLELLEADITHAELPLGEPTGRFDLVILALNTLLLISPREAQAAVLRNMALHLSPRGRAVVDVWLPRDADLALYDGRTTLDWVRNDGETGERVSKSTSAIHDPAADRATITTTYEAWHDEQVVGTTVRRDDVLFIGAAELLALAEASGLAPEAVHGDHAMGDFAPDSERIVLICRSRGR